jgi:hypothetical protein
VAERRHDARHLVRLEHGPAEALHALPHRGHVAGRQRVVAGDRRRARVRVVGSEALLERREVRLRRDRRRAQNAQKNEDDYAEISNEANSPV